MTRTAAGILPGDRVLARDGAPRGVVRAIVGTNGHTYEQALDFPPIGPWRCAGPNLRAARRKRGLCPFSGRRVV